MDSTDNLQRLSVLIVAAATSDSLSGSSWIRTGVSPAIVAICTVRITNRTEAVGCGRCLPSDRSGGVCGDTHAAAAAECDGPRALSAYLRYAEQRGRPATL